MFKFLEKYKIVALVMVVVILIANTISIMSYNASLNQRVIQLQKELINVREFQLKTLDTINKLHPIKDEAQKEKTEKYKKEMEDKLKAEKEKFINQRKEVEDIKANPNKITKESNLSYKPLTTDEMNKIIAYWDKYVDGGTPFKNKGDVFIKASKESGLDPVYILAHAAWESRWGKSEIAQDKHNYFGIAAFDANPYDCAYNMGSSLDTGIIQGAKWIKMNYYDKGYKNLNDMIALGNYASDRINWVNGIVSIMKESYAVI